MAPLVLLLPPSLPPSSAAPRTAQRCLRMHTWYPLRLSACRHLPSSATASALGSGATTVGKRPVPNKHAASTLDKLRHTSRLRVLSLGRPAKLPPDGSGGRRSICGATERAARANTTTGISGAVTAAAAAGMAAAGGWDSCFKSPWEEAGGGPARKAFAAAQLVSSLAGGWVAGTRGGGGEGRLDQNAPCFSG